MLVLDLAIGLVLVYFLYSLLSSIIAEIISSWIGMRARMLRQGIDNILNDKKIGSGQDFKNWLQDIFLVEDNNFKYTNAGKFYEEPTIKYLAKPGEQAWYSLRNRKPAYISPENFVITVLNMLSNKGRGISEWDKIKFSIETNAIHLEPETHKMFQDMVKRSNDNYKNFVDLLLHHFADTMDRVNGWYKRKIGTIIFYIGLLMCTIFNVDTFQIINTLSNDKEKRLQMVELAERVIDTKLKVDTLMSKTDSLDEIKYKMQAHGIVKGAVIEANTIMATGWGFKSRKRKENICISEDPTCWSCITERQAKYVEDSVKFSKGIRDKTNELLKEIKDNQLIVKDVKIKLDSASVLENKIKQLTMSIQDTIGLSFIEYYTTYRKGHVLWIEGLAYPSLTEKATVILKALTPRKSKFWGILITALALTLGAQFWFDLLKKLVSLRSSGVKPEENEEKKRQIMQLKLEGEKVTSKDPVEIAISENRAYWESLPGFIAYNVILEDDGSRYIEVSLNNDTIKSAPKNYIKPVFIDQTKSEDVKIKFKLAQLAKFEQGELQLSEFMPLKGHLYIESTKSYGTPAGLVKNRRTNQIAILTCGHVARPVKYSGFLTNTEISVKICDNPEKKEFTHVGKVSNIVMSSFADGGLIDIQNYKVMEKFNKIIHIDKVDHNHFGKKFYLINLKKEKKEGYLIDFSRFYAFDDGGKGNARFFNLLMFSPAQNNDYMSMPGDSGALVYNDKNVPVAIIIGGSQEVKKDKTIKYSYAIRLTDLKEILQFDLLSQNI